MQIRIAVENPVGNVKGLPAPHLDLVFGEKAAGYVKVYIVDPDASVPRAGPSLPYLLMSIRDLAAVVAALHE